MKKAFTLIELLVVIAIIAILAAILFPVFAQAKLAAKKTAGLSNQKQVALGVTMYVGDTDDTMPISNYSTAESPNGAITWAKAIEPYVKSWPLFRDPNESKSYGWDGPANYQWWGNYELWPNYGYNWTYFNLDVDCSQFGTTDTKTYNGGPPVSATRAANPASTLVITDSKIAGTSAGYYTSEGVESPAGLTAPGMCTWSNGGWGIGAYGDESGLYPNNPTSTGNVAPRQGGGMNAGYLDGHAKYSTPGNLAAGTNWQKGIANSAVQLIDKEKYVWDLD